MINLSNINQQLLKSEFDIARAIYDQARSEGFSAAHSAALVYRIGLKEGKASQKERISALYKKMYHRERCQDDLLEIEQSLPEVLTVDDITTAEEGSTNHES